MHPPIRRLVILLLSGLLQIAYATASEPRAANLVTQVHFSAERIEYRGVITAEANAAVFQYFEIASPRPRTLLIESPGGNAAAAIELGFWVFRRRLDVQIQTYCFSSCANYVFPAGRHKVLAPHAALMWHGGVPKHLEQQGLERVLDDTLRSMGTAAAVVDSTTRAAILQRLQRSHATLLAREAALFELLEVDPRITSIGQGYPPPSPRYTGWDLSIADLSRLGVDQVAVAGGGPWQPVSPSARVLIYRIVLPGEDQKGSKRF